MHSGVIDSLAPLLVGYSGYHILKINATNDHFTGWEGESWNVDMII